MKLKHLILILAVLLAPVLHGIYQPQVEASGQTVIAQGTTTLANTKLSLVAGAAFFDTSDNATFLPYVGETIQICNTSAMGQCIEGVIGNIGTGESGNLITSWVNRPSYEYETFESTGTAITSAINTSGWGIARASMVVESGVTYLITTTVTLNSGVIPYYGFQGGSGWLSSYNNFSSGSNSKYLTATGSDAVNGVLIISTMDGSTNTNFSTASVVVTKAIPSTTGFWIKSTPSATNGNAWSVKHASFDPNQASGFTWRIKSANPLGRNAISGSLTQAQTKLSLVDGTAFFDLGFTLPAWAKTITITDSAGKSIVGTVGAQGTGETYGSELLTTSWNSSPTHIWETFTTSGTAISSAVNSSGLGLASHQFTSTLTDLALYRWEYNLTSVSGSTPYGGLYVNQFGQGSYQWPSILSAGLHYNYVTDPIHANASNYLYLYIETSASFGLTNSFKQVLTPSTTGYWAYSTGTGTTKNWQSKDVAFDPNSSTFTYTASASGSVNPAAVHLATVDAGAMVEIVGAAPVALTSKVARISLVDGTAFVDTDGSYDLSGYVGKFITLTDTSGYKVSGWAKAAGSGETLSGTDAIANPSFDGGVTGWNTYQSSLASIPGGQANNCLELTVVTGTSQGATFTDSAFTRGAVYKANAYYKSGTSGNETGTFQLYNLGDNSYKATTFTTGASWTQTSSIYLVMASAGNNRPGIYKNSATAGTMLFDEVSIKQVLTPSVKGITIVSTSQGTTYNWAAKDTSFLPNAATFTITITDPDVNLASFADGNDTPTRVIINPKSTSAATAAIHPYLLVLEDTAGKVATGYIGSAGVGEALAAEKSTGTLTIGSMYKITATEADHFGTGFVVDRYFNATAATVCDANNKVQQVTEVSTSGTHLHSTPYATDRKLARVEAGFSPNLVTKFRVYRSY